MRKGLDVERHFERLIAMLATATANVEAAYFQLPVADADAVYRERVYCYELYHQLRCVWSGFPFGLGGEVDKTGHPHFQNGPYARTKPDLLIHLPGGMSDNLAIVEIKPSNIARGAINHDLRKLTWFCQNARYFRGIFIAYGEAGDPIDVANRIRQAVDTGVELERLACLYHRRVGEQADIILP